MFGFSDRSYSIRKSRHILRDRYQWYKRHWKELEPRAI